MSSRAHPPINPIVVTLQVGLQVLFIGLVIFVAVMVLVSPGASSAAVIGLILLLCATYAAGFALHGRPPARSRRALTIGWLLLLSAEWMLLVWLTPHAAYLAFPLFFLYLDVLPGFVGPVAVLVSAVAAIAALTLHNGWSVGGVVGPLVGAGVAVLIGMTYQALRRQSAEYARLYEDLLATQDRLAVTERESGALAERARLARDIHDTVAQSLSSITLLLHAAERSDPASAAMPSVLLARATATESLADTRGMIRALTPPILAEHSLAGALRRLADEQWSRPGLGVVVRVEDALDIAMPTQIALLRIAQGSMANVIEHAGATSAVIEITGGDDAVRLTITDDGRGFDVSRVLSESGAFAPDSFGLRAARERVDQLGGSLRVYSDAESGTVVTVDVPAARQGASS
jgi:signal transduction histidine kinase